MVSVDGTDFVMNEPEPFDPKWNSHKFKKAALKYEVTISIQTCDIVMVNGPFPGSVNDLVIFRNGLKRFLSLLERVDADSGYKDVKCSTPGDYNTIEEKLQKGRVLARHENINARFKGWRILKDVYRHSIEDHGDVFRAVAYVTQLELNHGRFKWHVRYTVNI